MAKVKWTFSLEMGGSGEQTAIKFIYWKCQLIKEKSKKPIRVYGKPMQTTGVISLFENIDFSFVPIVNFREIKKSNARKIIKQWIALVKSDTFCKDVEEALLKKYDRLNSLEIRRMITI